jgi:hypothetical protein
VKGNRHIWIPAFVAALPLLAVIHQTPLRKQWLWNLNVLPMAFVLSNASYLNTSHATLIFDDGSKTYLDRMAISEKVIPTRFDRTVFAHLVRFARPDSDEITNHLRNLFCNYSEDNKKVSRVDFEIFSAKADPIVRERASCR